MSVISDRPSTSASQEMPAHQMEMLPELSMLRRADVSTVVDDDDVQIVRTVQHERIYIGLTLIDRAPVVTPAADIDTDDGWSTASTDIDVDDLGDTSDSEIEHMCSRGCWESVIVGHASFGFSSFPHLHPMKAWI
jgi:hypothetical protein